FRLHAEGCYYYGSTPMTWADANSACVGMTANLVVIETDAERHFVDAFADIPYQYPDEESLSVWLGATDAVTEEEWLWVTGDSVGVDGWLAGSPKNSAAADDHMCVYNLLGVELRYVWDDADGTALLPYFCEM
ncbi:PREDICTED: C-type lectin domain family 4 member E-like, partial [Priapulus caudatus]|uniref:C-type lectin domain family 4 member E-like n=1 Tax=Priapulus caudatus TaxID=37621 RepID=A0ABM1F7H0_PRICU